MSDSMTQLEAFGELGKVSARLNDAVREQLVAMSPAMIDRLHCVAATRERDGSPTSLTTSQVPAVDTDPIIRAITSRLNGSSVSAPNPGPL